MGREIINPVRRHFIYDVQTDTSTCQLESCPKVIKGNHAANLQRHLARWHVAAYRQLVADKELINAGLVDARSLMEDQRRRSGEAEDPLAGGSRREDHLAGGSRRGVEDHLAGGSRRGVEDHLAGGSRRRGEVDDGSGRPRDMFVEMFVKTDRFEEEVPHPTKPPPLPAPKLPQPQHSTGRPPHQPSLAMRNAGMKPLAPKPRPPSPQPPPPPPEVCLRWNSYHSNMQATFPSLLNNQQFVDVTLACEGRSLKCHKVMLSACSAYFNELLSQNPCQHPIILMRDLKFWEVQSLVEFMYRGEVNVSQDKLPSLLSAAEALQIKGLASSPSPMMDDDMMSNSLPMMPDDYLEKETPSPASSRRIRRRRTIASAPTPPIKPTLLPNNQRSPRLQRVTPSTSGTHYHPEPHAQEPPTRKRRIDPSPIKSPSAFVSIKQEPLDINDHSNESEDLPSNHFLMKPSESEQSESNIDTTEANTIKNGKTEEATNNQNNSEEPATSEDEAHDNDRTDHDKEHNDNPPTDFDQRSDSPDDILQPEVTMNSDSVTGDD